MPLFLLLLLFSSSSSFAVWAWLWAVILERRKNDFGWRKWWFWADLQLLLLLRHLLLPLLLLELGFNYLYEFVYWFGEFGSRFRILDINSNINGLMWQDFGQKSIKLFLIHWKNMWQVLIIGTYNWPQRMTQRTFILHHCLFKLFINHRYKTIFSTLVPWNGLLVNPGSHISMYRQTLRGMTLELLGNYFLMLVHIRSEERRVGERVYISVVAVSLKKFF